MKHLNLILLLLLISVFISCKKKDVAPADPITQLPMATGYGANTIGCLVNGKALLPKSGGWMSRPYNCYYQYLDNSLSKGYYFNVSVNNSKDEPTTAVYVQSENIELEEGQTYPLTTVGVDGKAYAFYTVFYESGPVDYYTNETQRGELTITKLDRAEQIISGTFWFDAVSENGRTVEVREGRFDMKYVK